MSNGNESRLPAFGQRQHEPAVWDGLPKAEMAEVYARIGPSLGFSERKAAVERREPDYQPVSSSKHIDKVRYFNAGKGFGKIGEQDVFFHVTAVIDGNASFICKGVTLAYEEGTDRHGRVCAVDVQLVKDGA
ncbi:cold-shock protein [Paenibacillus sp. PL91]|uniref:cold-shock protein n=1 Tax=Paenibacillus sp. PL91 TaxID=2729538 RepID=UPI00145D054E|nr:cold shock domain-containing protein [Paenibacillus sp. PL91]MBC9199769.1 cold shock domain-containing protein [Paenibacillus sp. PL91]